jgi:hypothetical protein
MKTNMMEKQRQTYSEDAAEFDNFKIISLTSDGSAAKAKISFTVNMVRSVTLEKDGTGWKISGFMNGLSPKKASNPAKGQ